MELDEIKDIIISALVLAFIFSYTGINIYTIQNFPYSLFAISFAFLFHELAHRQVAKYFECFARYKMWTQGLIFAVLFALLTNGNFVFAAPGAVVIHPRIDLWGRVRHISKSEYGKIAIAGPVTNLLLAIVFFILFHIFLLDIFLVALRVNLWLCIFNLIPFPPLDGFTVFQWNKYVWISVLAMSLILFLF